ncbi:MAG TPA: T9SS type A sorting domain-containing protein, partial [Rhodothermales bacterium]|nr:T9SS type A sorting domain-containing protein [Rhodothermales bacterium]
DLIGHSNGGIVGSLYLRTYPESADRVHRLITIGTPYLGTPQGSAAQTRGYVFGVDENMFFDADWGRMLEMTRNIPGAYGLMPSKAYWQAMKVGENTNQRDHYLVDLYNMPLRSYDSTFSFLTRAKVFQEGESTEGQPPGLARNAAIWQDQQENVHDLIDDWRSYNRPPQIFRFAGDQAARTAVGWELGPGKKSFFDSEAERSEPGDTDDHRGYRERLVPVLGRGDGTVALLSATLGHNQDVGETDLSGVDESPWIEEFEYYDCEHVGLIAENCARTDGGIMALDRVVEVLRSGYEIIPQAEVTEDSPDVDPPDLRIAASRADWSTPVREVFYVTGSAPLAVDIRDESGKHIGPSAEAGYGTIEYELPEVAYWPGKFTVVISAPIEKGYRVTASAPEGPANVQLTRMTVREDGGQFYKVFQGEDLASGGSVAFELVAGGLTSDARLMVDADADGVAERDALAGMSLSGFFGTQPVPTVRPAAIHVSTPAGQPAEASVEFAALEGLPWTWSVSANADWVLPDVESGELPGAAGFKLGSPSLPDGIYRDTLTFTLSYFEGFSTEALVPVELRIGAVNTSAEDSDTDLPRAFALLPNAPNPFSQQTTIRFDLPRPSAVRLVVYDMLGRSVAVLADGSYPAGRHALTLDAGRFPSGVYLYRLETDGGTFTRRMLVVR